MTLLQPGTAPRPGLASLLLACLLLAAAAPSRGEEVDLENGFDINETCAGCHGVNGEGGKEGEYPRLAGLPAAYLARQLHLYRDRERPNLAMIEYVDERQMPDPDIRDIAAYLAAIELPIRMPDLPEDATSLEKLRAAEKVFNVPRVEGDPDAGQKIYKRECASCHGPEGWGDESEAVPMLAGQYTQYLWRSVDKYLKGTRIHDPSDPEYRLLAEFSETEIRDIFAYLSTVDDQ